MLMLSVTLAAIAYFGIGYVLGHWSWRVFHEVTSAPKWIDFVLWPFSSVFTEYGLIDPRLPKEGDDITGIIDEMKTAKAFAMLMGMIWPLKVATNLVIILWTGIVVMGFLLLDALFYPLRRISRHLKH